jgi:hypothetical protein
VDANTDLADADMALAGPGMDPLYVNRGLVDVDRDLDADRDVVCVDTT